VRLTKDPVLTVDAQQRPFCHATIASGFRYPKRDANGNQVKDAQGRLEFAEDPFFGSVSCGGPMALRLSQVKKGDQIFIEGHSKTRKYNPKDKDGNSLLDDEGKPVMREAQGIALSHFRIIPKMEKSEEVASNPETDEALAALDGVIPAEG
jgi:hypothetical protein